MSDIMTGDAWRARAACRGMDTAMFFPEGVEDLAPAKAVCATCPVQTECLDTALSNSGLAQYGVWGGKSARARRRILRQRLRAAV